MRIRREISPEPSVEPPEEVYLAPVCPLCGFEAEMFYFKDGKCIGCDDCIQYKFFDDLQEDEL